MSAEDNRVNRRDQKRHQRRHGMRGGRHAWSNTILRLQAERAAALTPPSEANAQAINHPAPARKRTSAAGSFF